MLAHASTAPRRIDGPARYAVSVRILLDLDNTLVDRDGAFYGWAEEFVASISGDHSDVDWLCERDNHGYRPRAEIAAGINDRFGYIRSTGALVSEMRDGVATRTQCYDGVLAELRRLKDTGAVLVIVTNGGVEQQKRKIVTSGLTPYVDAAIISEGVGAKKPDRRIFEEALRGDPGETTPWMVGDHPVTDMAGARAAGLCTAWISHSSSWSEAWTPDIIRSSTTAALRDLQQLAANPRDRL